MYLVCNVYIYILLYYILCNHYKKDMCIYIHIHITSKVDGRVCMELFVMAYGGIGS